MNTHKQNKGVHIVSEMGKDISTQGKKFSTGYENISFGKDVFQTQFTYLCDQKGVKSLVCILTLILTLKGKCYEYTLYLKNSKIKVNSLIKTSSMLCGTKSIVTVCAKI